MRAIVLVTGRLEQWPQLSERTLASLLPLGDRPFLRHVVESLVDRGITELDVVSSRHASQVEELLGDGSRWGVRVRHHLVRDPDRPCDCLRRLAERSNDEALLLVGADALVRDLRDPVDLTDLRGAVAACTSDPELDIGPVHWSGWAWVPPAVLTGLPPGCDASELEFRVVESARRDGLIVDVGTPLRAAPLEMLVSSQRRVLEDGGERLLLTGREELPGVRVGRGAVIDPTARLVPPVFVGEDTRVGAGVQLGPNASVGERCVLDDDCVVADSVIRPGAYLGRGIEVRDSVVDGDLVAHLRVGAEVAVVDDFLLARVDGSPAGGARRLAGRALSAALLLLSAPVLALVAAWLKLVRPGPVLSRRDVVLQPAPVTPEQWRTTPTWTLEEPCRAAPEPGLSDLVLRVLPGLVTVVRGGLDLVGLPPRTPEEMSALPDQWRSICLSARAGLISESLVRHGSLPTEDEAFAADALQAVRGGLRHDISLFLEYIRCIGHPSPDQAAEPRILRSDPPGEEVGRSG